MNLFRPTLVNFVCASLGTSQITKGDLVEKVSHEFPDFSRLSIIRALSRAINLSRITVLPLTSLGSHFLRLNIQEPSNFPILVQLAQTPQSFLTFDDPDNPENLFVAFELQDSLKVLMLSRKNSQDLSDALAANVIATFGATLTD